MPGRVLLAICVALPAFLSACVEPPGPPSHERPIGTTFVYMDQSGQKSHLVYEGRREVLGEEVYSFSADRGLQPDDLRVVDGALLPDVEDAEPTGPFYPFMAWDLGDGQADVGLEGKDFAVEVTTEHRLRTVTIATCSESGAYRWTLLAYPWEMRPRTVDLERGTCQDGNFVPSLLLRESLIAILPPGVCDCRPHAEVASPVHLEVTVARDGAAFTRGAHFEVYHDRGLRAARPDQTVPLANGPTDVELPPGVRGAWVELEGGESYTDESLGYGDAEHPVLRATTYLSHQGLGWSGSLPTPPSAPEATSPKFLRPSPGYPTRLSSMVARLDWNLTGLEAAAPPSLRLLLVDPDGAVVAESAPANAGPLFLALHGDGLEPLRQRDTLDGLSWTVRAEGTLPPLSPVEFHVDARADFIGLRGVAT